MLTDTHVYQGETYKIASGLSEREADTYCAKLAAYINRAQGDERFEVERMPESESPRKVGRPKGKVLSPITGESGAGDVTDPVAPVDSDLYAKGCYREPCKVCGEGIPRTGKRGRAPIYHEQCRPESE